VAQGRNEWRAVVNTVMNLRVPWSVGKLSFQATSEFSRMTQFHVLSTGPIAFSAQRERRRTERDIPGPGPALPVLGTRWIYSTFGPYKMNQIHEAYRGEYRTGNAATYTRKQQVQICLWFYMGVKLGL
jgi:hypothetical protein